MSVLEMLLAVLLAAAAAAVTYGVAQIYVPAGWIVGGVLAALWGVLVLVEVKPARR